MFVCRSDGPAGPLYHVPDVITLVKHRGKSSECDMWWEERRLQDASADWMKKLEARQKKYAVKYHSQLKAVKQRASRSTEESVLRVDRFVYRLKEEEKAEGMEDLTW